jgi:4-amino-4-deoxy-L-arabinose transferase-like glycosyltransferase
MNTLAGLGVVALAVLLARGPAPGDRRREALAAGLLLFLPAHVAMSAMVAEEMLAALFVSAALVLLLRPPPGARGAGFEWRRAAAVGATGGLAALTKLSGALVVPVAAATLAEWARRRGAARAGAARAALLLVVAALVGGWFYARNRVLYGSFVPFGLPAHREMFAQPPGERALSDYLRFPLATFRDPQLLDPDLLRSVWGGTYASAWFDAPLAFALGLARGARRALRRGSPDDLALVSLVVLTLFAYALYTWRNPWYTTVKGTTLLPLSLPFAYYASEVLADWTRRRGATGPLVWLLLAALALCATLASTFDLAFHKSEVPGLTWPRP